MDTPFQVICIDGVKAGCKGLIGREALSDELIYEGERYTVEKELVFHGIPCYKLKERWEFAVYRKTRFIPVSDIDEAERSAEHQHEAIIYAR